MARAVADLEAAAVKRVTGHDGCDRYTFTIPLDHGAELEAYVVADGDTLDFADLLTKNHAAHPAAFDTGAHGGYYGRGVHLGTAETRRVLHHIISYVRNEHPEIRHLKSTRVTGARNLSGKRSLDITL